MTCKLHETQFPHPWIKFYWDPACPFIPYCLRPLSSCNGRVQSVPQRVCGLKNLSCLPSGPVVGRKMPPSKDGRLTNATFMIVGKLLKMDREGQEGLACCSSWGRKESHTTGRVNNKDAHVSVSKDVMKDHNKLWEILKEMGIPDHLTCLLRNLCMQVRKQQFELDMEQQTGSK